ncbi:MAG TPA: HD domain-containing phosphohydrolase [Candidatus Angelobacter sp.]|jgi:diguanylate cyclase (GGDEF)-like protein/putative nucleotidyltransferase with HDIG domain
MSKQARIFIFIVCLGGLATTIYGGLVWNVDDLPKFAAYLITAMLASRLKVELPEITGTISVNFLFILIGIAELTFSETLVLGCSAILIQCLVTKRRLPRPEQVFFNVSSAAVAIWAAYFTYHGPMQAYLHGNSALLMMLSAGVYFLLNTLPVATIISLTENKSLQKIWTDCYFWSLPYYMAGGAVAALFGWVNQRVGWQPTLLALPAMFITYRSYRLYLGKLANEKNHVAEMAALHMRTIEALALAIEAKDQTTHDHLERVRVYAVEMAKKLNLPPDEVEALRAAALLHDIGKLAVPEHIISKPGRLTPEEFEKMKIHPIVGAEILERVHFPYPVVPIVRCHHERWDGAGYPDGLKGEEIPIGARILSAVDCLDALATDRQYRKALPLDDAMQWVADQAGKAYDPKVVAVLKASYKELEEIVHTQSLAPDRQKLSTGLKIEHGKAPANGFEAAKSTEPGSQAAFLSSIAAARQEAQALFELTQDLGNSLSLSETLSVLSGRLKRLVPYDAIATYIVRGNELLPEYVSGDNFRLFASLRIPLGEGLSGWVAQNRKPMLNGNPGVEHGYVHDPVRFSALRSAISVPLEGIQGVVGVLTLYHADQDAYTPDHLRILLAISSKVALSVENALAFQEAESSATTDYLTELPNARSLFLHLDRELARCKRLQSSLTVMVCDLDGFKKINDRFGHIEGNRILRHFAETLQGSCREYDYVARMGGDEFVIVAPGLSASAAEARGICLSQLAGNAGREICGVEWLSLSVGCAIYPDDGVDAEKLLAEADRRMYLQKQEHHKALKALNSLTEPRKPNGVRDAVAG